MIGNIIVCNKHNSYKRKDYIYIPIYRPHPLGNPYVLTKEEQRNDVIEKFKNNFDLLYSEKEEFKKAIDDVIIILSKGQNVAMECYCKPKPCHGDIIKEKILEMMKNKISDPFDEI